APERPGQAEEGQAWRAHRSAAAREHAQALERARAAETARARSLLEEFVAQAEADGPAAVPLRVRSYDGRVTYRTPLRGWYLRRNRSVAVDTSGAFYVLTAPSSLLGLLRGVTPEPSDPPLVLGKGARDGESIDLADALALVLASRPRTPG
uniref:hypothetical protein n=1 Tax=Actinotalea sp. C106 TaxID=2908644 RepID=UPI0020297159